MSFYRNGKFVDFCRGPHVPSTGRVKAVKVMSISGAYWLGSEKNPQLQRIYGTAFFSKKDLDEYLERLEEAKRRDHRATGQGAGAVHGQRGCGRGAAVVASERRDDPRGCWRSTFSISSAKRGYEHVYTPDLAKVDLWKSDRTLGALTRKTCTRPWSWRREQMVLRPMNCPHHILIYESKLARAIAICPCARGAGQRCIVMSARARCSGLSRVRCMTLNDAHIFCTPEQIEEECLERDEAGGGGAYAIGHHEYS